MKHKGFTLTQEKLFVGYRPLSRLRRLAFHCCQMATCHQLKAEKSEIETYCPIPSISEMNVISVGDFPKAPTAMFILTHVGRILSELYYQHDCANMVIGSNRPRKYIPVRWPCEALVCSSRHSSSLQNWVQRRYPARA